VADNAESALTTPGSSVRRKLTSCGPVCYTLLSVSHTMAMLVNMAMVIIVAV